MSRSYVIPVVLLAALSACGPDQRRTETAAAPAPSSRATPPDSSATPDSPATPAAATVPAVAPPPPVPPAPDSAFLLRRGFVGPLRLNMKEAALQAAVPAASLRKTTRTLAGIEYPVYEYRPAGSPATARPLLLELVGDEEEGYRLWRVQVRDSRYRTREAVGVGSTFGKARAAYGIQTVERSEAGVVAVSERMYMSWILDAKNLAATGPLRKDRIPASTPITGVILFR